MKRKTLMITTTLAALGIIIAVGSQGFASGSHQSSRFGHHGGGYSMMGHGGGMGMMGMMGGAPCANSDDASTDVDRNLTTEQASDIIKGRLAMRGNPNLKLGPVNETEDGMIRVDIVTQDNSLVRSFQFDKKTGSMRPIR